MTCFVSKPSRITLVVVVVVAVGDWRCWRQWASICRCCSCCRCQILPGTYLVQYEVKGFCAFTCPSRVISPIRLWLCAGLVGTKLCPGRAWSISTLGFGPDQPDPRRNLTLLTLTLPLPNPNPLGGSRSAGAATRLRRVFRWCFSK